MAHDTTALNHTYSTTTTGTAGETVNTNVTASTAGFVGKTYANLPSGLQVTTIGTFATAQNMTGTLYLTTIAGGTAGGQVNNCAIFIRNSSGVEIKRWSLGNILWYNNQARSLAFTGLLDAKTVHFEGQNIYISSGYHNGISVSLMSWTGYITAGRDPSEMNSSANDGSGSIIYYASIPATNPFVTGDFGSSTRMASVAIMPRTQNTETVFQIQTSNDGSTWVTNRTILASKLTNWVYNYVKLTPVIARYVRIYGYSGSSKIISFDEIKVKVGITDTTFLDGHYHQDISTSDTSLSLAGD